MAAVVKSPRALLPILSLELSGVDQIASMKMTSPRSPRSPRGTKESDLKQSFPASPRYQRELEKQFQCLDYFGLHNQLRHQVPCKTNLYRLKMYDNTVLANDIVRWLIASGYAQNIYEACFLGSQLVVHGHIYNPTDEDDDDFQNNNQPFRFAIDDRVGFAIHDIDLDQVERLLFYSRREEILRNGVVFRDALSGSEAIDLILSKGLLVLRSDATHVCQKLLVQGSLIMLASDGTKLEFNDDPESIYGIVDGNLHNLVSPKSPSNGTMNDLLHDEIENANAEEQGVKLPVSKQGSKFSNISCESDDGKDIEVRSLRNLFRHISKPLKHDVDTDDSLNATSNATSPSSKMITLKNLLTPTPRAGGLSRRHTSRFGLPRKLPMIPTGEDIDDDTEPDMCLDPSVVPDPSLVSSKASSIRTKSRSGLSRSRLTAKLLKQKRGGGSGNSSSLFRAITSRGRSSHSRDFIKSDVSVGTPNSERRVQVGKSDSQTSI